ncbi:UPF0394 membrane protein XF_0766 [Brucella sp. NBRC 12953]|uniref:YeeE/YedE family protein n=1 Tax=Brucella sp. NBRC 12953 TaxID=3075481 RepID=UPI0030B0A67E
MNIYLSSLIGGMLIGTSAAMLLILNGRIAGISGLVGSLIQGRFVWINLAFLTGLILGPIAYLMIYGDWPLIQITTGWPLIVVAGLLVGFGSRMGSGCTSGHGVVGLARLSRRSMVAVATFLTTGVIAVTVLRGMGL